MKKSMQITIIGAGPVGCYLGQLLKRYGFSPLLLEEHREIGKPVHCAGLVGGSFFKDLKVTLPESLIKTKLNGAIISYKNNTFTLRRKNAALVIDREKLDKELSIGLDIKTETRLTSLQRKNQGYLVHTNNQSIYSDIVIGADGATSTIRKIANFKLNPTYRKGIQIRMKQKSPITDMVLVDFIKPFLQFSWLIPEDNEIVRIGSISSNPLKTVNFFLSKLNLQGEIVEKEGGVLVEGYGETYKDNIALVGDAACQVKPLSGGGLYYGMRCAEILAECIKEGNLSLYDKRWKSFLGREIKSALKIKKMLERRNLSFLEKLFTLAQKNSHLIEQVADFEKHSLGILAIVKRIGLILPGV